MKIRDISFLDMAEMDNDLYFFCSLYNSLFKITKNNHVEWIGIYEGEELYQRDMFSKAVPYRDKIFFIPLTGRKIVAYDVINKEFSSIDLELSERESGFVQVEKNGDDLLLIPQNINTPFTIFNMDALYVKTIDEINRKIKDNVKLPDVHENFSFYCTVNEGDYLYLTVADTNVVIKYVWSTSEIDFIRLLPEIHLKNISKIGNDYWITLMENKILNWNPKDDCCELFDVPDVSCDTGYPYLSMCGLKDTFLLLAGREGVTWRISKDLKKWEKVKYPDGFGARTPDVLLFSGWSNYDKEKMLLYPRGANGILQYDISSGSVNVCEIKQYDVEIKKAEQYLVKEYWKKKQIICEGEMALSDYLYDISIV